MTVIILSGVKLGAIRHTASILVSGGVCDAVYSVLLLLGHVMNSASGGEFSVQANLVYGMYSGTALLMDAYIPGT